MTLKAIKSLSVRYISVLLHCENQTIESIWMLRGFDIRSMYYTHNDKERLNSLMAVFDVPLGKNVAEWFGDFIYTRILLIYYY